MADHRKGGGGSTQDIATQLGILNSQSIALTVIERLALYRNPSFIHGKTTLTAMPVEDDQKASLVRHFQVGLTVLFERDTNIAQIRYTSTDPALAAAIANAVANAYIDQNYQSRYTSMRKASEWLTGQLDTLKDEVVKDEKEFADFQQQTGILRTDEAHDSDLDRFSALNAALTGAQVVRMTKEIAYRQSATTDADIISGESPEITAARGQIETLQAERAFLKGKYGNEYPRVVQLNKQIEEVEKTLDKLKLRGIDRLRVDYETALKNENDLRGALDQQKQQIFSSNEKALQYNILQRQVNAGRDLYEDLNKKLQEAQLNSGLNAETISVLDTALKPNVPVSPNKTRNIEVGFMGGLFLGIVFAFLLENLNVTVNSVDDISVYAELPILSIVPHLVRQDDYVVQSPLDTIPARFALDNPNAHFTEAFRTLRSSLLLSSAGLPPKVILVCSAWPKEGKSTVSLNLAIVLAQMGKQVLLVDADLRRPTLEAKLGLHKSAIGLSGLLTNENLTSDDALVDAGLNVPTLHVLAAGPPPPSSSELLLSDRMKQLLLEWRGRFDFVVIDTAPVLAVSDTASLASSADAVMMVVRAGVTRRQALRAARDNIVSVKGKLVGVLLNDVTTSSDMYYDYYGGKGYYGAYYAEGKNGG